MESLRGSRRSASGYAQLENSHATVSRLAAQDNVPWYKKPNLRALYLLMFPTCFTAQLVFGFDEAMMNALQAVPSWIEYYGHPRSALLGLVGAAFAIGGFVASPFVPLVADNLGRRYSIVFGGIVSMLGGILQGSAMNISVFIVARLISGIGVTFAIVAALALVGELSHPKERAVIGAIMHTCYYIGAVAAAGIALATHAIPNNWGWRIPSLLQTVPSLLQVSLVLCFPESPRWLISKGRQDEAFAILTKYHSEGNNGSEFVKAEYTQIEQTLRLELENAQMNMKDILSAPGMRKRFIIASFLALFTQWSGTGLISHFLALILDSVGIRDYRMKNIINLAKFSWGLVNGSIFALIAPRYPRRKMFLACTVSLFVFFVCWATAGGVYAETHSNIASRVVVGLIFLYSIPYNLAFATLTYPFLVEIFPFHVRAWGLSAFQLWARGGAFFNQFVNPIGLGALGWKWYLFYCVWTAFQVAFVYFMFPETSGRSLEELTFLFEDDRRPEDPGRTDIRGPQGCVDTERHDTSEASLSETVVVRRE